MSNPAADHARPVRLDDVVALIVQLAAGDLTARGELSGRGDELDALMGGLNMLAEELEITFDAVERRTTELEKANAELTAAQAQLLQSSKLASLGEIAAGIAHELNQPLGIIQLYCESALRAIAAADGEEMQSRVAGNLDVAIAQVRRASEIIETVRAFAREDKSVEMADAALGGLVGGALLLLRRELGELDIGLVERLEPGLRTVRCREPRVQQVLFNLVSNARDAVAGRVGALIELHVFGSGDDVVFDVRDNGAGVPAADLPKIMDPFFTTKPAGQGTGLGLPICQTIAAEHGGSISHERRDGHTIFSLRIPQ